MIQNLTPRKAAGAILLSLCGGWVAAGAEVDIASIMGQPVVDKDLPWQEVQRFTESRVPAMPKPANSEEWDRIADKLRQDVLDKLVFRGKAARWRDAETKVEWLDTIPGGPGYHLKKLRYEALPGLWIPAILYEPDKLDGKVPVSMAVNGHVGGEGKAIGYKQIRCINQAKRGMLVLNPDWLGMGQLGGDGFYHYRMNQLDLCGTSGLAPYYLAMKRGLDVLLSHPHADPKRVAVSGLSGGGWQTIFISSLDTRVTLANPVAGYSSFRTRARFTSDLGDSEQTPSDLATVADYTHLTAMRAPRPTLLTNNAKDDCCFASDHALPPLLDAAGPIFKLYNASEKLRSHINSDPGTHNYEKENREAFYEMLKDFFAADPATFDAKEIPSEAEVKKPDDLKVPLPDENADFHSLAMKLSERLPRPAPAPEDKEAFKEWQHRRREQLRKLVHFKSYPVKAEKHAHEESDNLHVTQWRLKLGDDWTVPATELTRGKPVQTTILIADTGRKSAAEEASRLLIKGERVVAVDPFYFGESKISQRDALYALLVAAVGERPLGIQAAQVDAVAGWIRSAHPAEQIALVAVGPRTSAIAAVAAALNEKTIDRVELYQSLPSLKKVIENNWSVDQYPELFCFGLLEQFDMKDILSLTAPRAAIVH